MFPTRSRPPPPLDPTPKDPSPPNLFFTFSLQPRAQPPSSPPQTFRLYPLPDRLPQEWLGADPPPLSPEALPVAPRTPLLWLSYCRCCYWLLLRSTARGGLSLRWVPPMLLWPSEFKVCSSWLIPIIAFLFSFDYPPLLCSQIIWIFA
jgi:hypothetical protein